MKNWLKVNLDQVYYLVIGKQKIERFFILIEKNPVLEKLFKEIENRGFVIIVSRFLISCDAMVSTEKVEKPGMIKEVWLNYKTINRALSKDPYEQLIAIEIISHEVGHILNREVRVQIDAQRKFFCSRENCLYIELLACETGLNFIQKELKDRNLRYTHGDQLIEVDVGASLNLNSLSQCSDCISLIFSNSPSCPFAPEIKAILPIENPEYEFLYFAHQKNRGN